MDCGNQGLFYLFVKGLYTFPLSAGTLEQPGKKDRNAETTVKKETMGICASKLTVQAIPRVHG
jgi:hypothetical protein